MLYHRPTITMSTPSLSNVFRSHLTLDGENVPKSGKKNSRRPPLQSLMNVNKKDTLAVQDSKVRRFRFVRAFYARFFFHFARSTVDGYRAIWLYSCLEISPIPEPRRVLQTPVGQNVTSVSILARLLVHIFPITTCLDRILIDPNSLVASKSNAFSFARQANI